MRRPGVYTESINTVATIADTIRNRRHELGLTVRELAAQIHKSAGYVSQLETRGVLPSPATICALATALRLDTEQFLATARAEELKAAAERIDTRHDEALRLFRRSK